MKLDKPKKIVLGVLSILIIWATILTTPTTIKTIKTIKNLNKKPPKIALSFRFKQDEINAAIKYDLYPELFKSNEPILIYGYKPGAIIKNQGESFHNELTALLEREQINHKVIPYKNGEQTIEKYESRYLDRGCNGNTCSELTKEPENIEENNKGNIEDAIYTIKGCLNHACIIDMKKKRYIQISRDPEYIIKFLKGEANIHN